MRIVTGHETKGRWVHRLKQNPEERRFADAWSKEHVLWHLLGDGLMPRTPTAAESETAATIIQWLGSPVGQDFLSDLGYKR